MWNFPGWEKECQAIAMPVKIRATHRLAFPPFPIRQKRSMRKKIIEPTTQVIRNRVNAATQTLKTV